MRTPVRSQHISAGVGGYEVDNQPRYHADLAAALRELSTYPSTAEYASCPEEQRCINRDQH